MDEVTEIFNQLRASLGSLMSNTAADVAVDTAELQIKQLLLRATQDKPLVSVKRTSH